MILKVPMFAVIIPPHNIPLGSESSSSLKYSNVAAPVLSVIIADGVGVIVFMSHCFMSTASLQPLVDRQSGRPEQLSGFRSLSARFVTGSTLLFGDILLGNAHYNQKIPCAHVGPFNCGRRAG